MPKTLDQKINHPAWEPTDTTGLWDLWEFRTLRSAFSRSKFHGMVREYQGPIRFEHGGLGAWHWERMFPLSETNLTEYVVLHVLTDPPATEHHGRMNQENILAHMLVHVERGSQCTSIDPQDWGVECRIVEFEAMNRMGWNTGNCDLFNPFTKAFHEWDGPSKGYRATAAPQIV